jgi:hypothetical protein
MFSAMGSTSVPVQGSPKILTLYCNPFFRRCKQFFYKKQKIFQRQCQNPEKSSYEIPKTEKQGAQPASCGELPEEDAGNQPEKIAQSDIPAANGEVQNQPKPGKPRNKQQIPQKIASPSQGTKKTVVYSQRSTQKKTAGKPVSCGFRIHRSSLLQKLSGRCS